MRPLFQKALAILLLMCALLAWAGGSKWKSAKVLEVRDASETGASVAANNSVGVADTALVGGVVPRCRVTVALDGVSYSAIFPVDKHFKPTDLAEGEEVSARVEGNKLVLERPDGKEMKAKVVNQKRIE